MTPAKRAPAASAQGAPRVDRARPSNDVSTAPTMQDASATAEIGVTGCTEQDHDDGHVCALQRRERRDEAEVADLEAVQQAEEGAEVEDAGERSQPGARHSPPLRQPPTTSITGRMMATPVASTQTICVSGRVSRVTRCENMSLVAYEREVRRPVRTVSTAPVYPTG